MSVRTWRKGTRNSILYLFTLVVIGLLVGSSPGHAANNSTTTTTAPSKADDARECPNSWLIQPADHEHARWFADGIDAINKASTPEEAKAAAQAWLEQVRRDPQLMVGAVSYFLHKDVNPENMVDATNNKCASTDAVSLEAELELAIAQAKATPDNAPANGTNSGVDANGTAVAASHPGISGNRKAVKLVLQDGTTIWVMARCGNPVVQGQAPVPPGPTDQQHPTPTVPGTIPPTRGTTPPTSEVPNQTTTTKPALSRECQQNGTGCPDGFTNPVRQDPQDNHTSGANTGPTPGAPSSPPSTSPQGPPPRDNTPAPPPNSGGSNSGSPSGNNTPGGSACDSSGCSGGGSSPPQSPPTTVDNGNHGGDPGGF